MFPSKSFIVIISVMHLNLKQDRIYFIMEYIVDLHIA